MQRIWKFVEKKIVPAKKGLFGMMQTNEEKQFEEM